VIIAILIFIVAIGIFLSIKNIPFNLIAPPQYSFHGEFHSDTGLGLIHVTKTQPASYPYTEPPSCWAYLYIIDSDLPMKTWQVISQFKGQPGDITDVCRNDKTEYGPDCDTCGVDHIDTTTMVNSANCYIASCQGGGGDSCGITDNNGLCIYDRCVVDWGVYRGGVKNSVRGQCASCNDYQHCGVYSAQAYNDEIFCKECEHKILSDCVSYYTGGYFSPSCSVYSTSDYRLTLSCDGICSESPQASSITFDYPFYVKGSCEVGKYACKGSNLMLCGSNRLWQLSMPCQYGCENAVCKPKPTTTTTTTTVGPTTTTIPWYNQTNIDSIPNWMSLTIGLLVITLVVLIIKRRRK